MTDTLAEYIRLFPEPIAIVNGSGEILAINDGASLFWQRHTQELIGESLALLLQQSQEQVQGWLKLCQGNAQMLAAHFPVPQPEGNHWVLEGVGVNLHDEPVILTRIVPSFSHNQQLLARQLQQLQRELARQIALVKELQQCQQALEQEKQHLQSLAEQDALTGLGNRRFFDAALNRLWQQTQAEGQALTVALIDIDDFKAYNDCCGHLAGDRVLQQVAQTLKAHLRSNDVIARYGGEEFALVLPYVSAGAALQILERMLHHVRELKIPQADTAHHRYITVSAGLCFVPAGESQSTLTEMLAIADTALYQAKKQGRDRAILLEWSQEAVPRPQCWDTSWRSPPPPLG
ncbi:MULTISPECIES: GGDEF domain-containing protein [unclassified Thermosynechococcus]|uniref:GGDEF domain-containing protein n=1 Tax=unclassified Thermosynechococcus TaxID=2622553 RepID=UPI0019EA7242|nr:MULTISPECIES: GGDEF domain-containing protein [unclassified Thermosynechococcus]HIK22084.1 GGDEF domain-containing protein [Thermosynechococcus sp. M3746_W2019_013]